MCVALTADRFGSFGEGWIETSLTDSNKFRHRILWGLVVRWGKSEHGCHHRWPELINKRHLSLRSGTIHQVAQHVCCTCLLHTLQQPPALQTSLVLWNRQWDISTWPHVCCRLTIYNDSLSSSQLCTVQCVCDALFVPSGPRHTVLITYMIHNASQCHTMIQNVPQWHMHRNESHAFATMQYTQIYTKHTKTSMQ